MNSARYPQSQGPRPMPPTIHRDAPTKPCRPPIRSDAFRPPHSLKSLLIGRLPSNRRPDRPSATRHRPSAARKGPRPPRQGADAASRGQTSRSVPIFVSHSIKLPRRCPKPDRSRMIPVAAPVRPPPPHRSPPILSPPALHLRIEVNIASKPASTALHRRHQRANRRRIFATMRNRSKRGQGRG